MSPPNVAIVHDWLTGLRGGEKVLEVCCELYDDAAIYSLFRIPGTTGATIESRRIETSFVQVLPSLKRNYRWYLPLFPWGIESLELPRVDVVISSSHCVAKGVLPPPGAVHICYCHTPMRYIWDRFTDYFGSNLRSRLVFGPIAAALRRWDIESASRVDHFIANSSYVAQRIERYYSRKAAAIIHPPVDVEQFTPATSDAGSRERRDPYYLIVSALAPYKRVDLAIEAFRERKERLVIVGTGPQEKRLRSQASERIEFRGRVAPEELVELYRDCEGCLLPGVEDFGIAPVEAQACGRPAIAFAEGGALDTVRDGTTGVLFFEQTPRALSQAIDKAKDLGFNKTALRDWADQFSRARFKSKLAEFVQARAGTHEPRPDELE